MDDSEAGKTKANTILEDFVTKYCCQHFQNQIDEHIYFLPAAERSRSISRFSSWDQSAVQESKKPEQIISIFPPFYLHRPHAPKLAQIWKHL